MAAQETTWLQLATQSQQLAKQGRYVEAVPIASEALKRAEAEFGPDKLQINPALNILAFIDFNLGRFADAETLWKRALQIAEENLGPNDLVIAADLNNLASLFVSQGRFADAEPLLQRALAIKEKTLGPDNPQTANGLNSLSQLYYEQGRYSEAEPLARRTVAIDEKALGPESVGLAQELSNLAMICLELSKYSEADPLFQRALQILEIALGPDHPNVGTLLNNIGLLDEKEGRYAEAEIAQKGAIRIAEKTLGPDHPDVAVAINNLAMLYKEQAKYAEAESIYQRALQIYEKAFGPNHPRLAIMLNNLAEIYEDEGRFALAEPLFQRAVRIQENGLGPEAPALATTLGNQALLYMNQGKYAEAELVFLRAQHIHEKVLGQEHPLVATDLNNRALLYEDHGRFAEAEPLLLRSFQIDQKALGHDHPRVIGDLNNIGMFFLAAGSYAQAQQTLQGTLEIREKSLGPNSPEVATSLNNLALVLEYQGQYAQAEPLYQRSLRIMEAVFGPDHPYVALGLLNLASTYDEQGDFASAEPLFQRALINVYQQFQYNFRYMTEKERLGFLDGVANDFPAYFSFVHRFHDKDPALIGSMYNVLLWEKGFVATGVGDLRRRVESSGDPAALNLLAQLTAKRSQIAALLNIQPPDRTIWRKQIDQLKTEAIEIERALVAHSSGFAEREKLDVATWQQVRDALQPGEAAVEFARFSYFEKKHMGADRYVALVITHGTKNQPQYIYLGDDKQIEKDAAHDFRQSVQTRGFLREPKQDIPGTRAYQLIWKPLESALGGVSRIYLSPDGVLNQVPLGIIPTPDGQLLMEHYDLRLVSSTKNLLRSAALGADTPALLVGDPVFDLSEDRQRAAIEKIASPPQPAQIQMTALSPSDHSRDLGSGVTLPRLPGTGLEVSAIASLMRQHGWKTDVYTGDQALKRVVEQAASPRVVHLATHGFFLSDQQAKTGASDLGDNRPSGLEDPMLRSGLYFAAADRTLAGKPSPSELDNGVLTALEASNLNLSGTRLVVLSACDTGRGDVKNGEGVFGLRRALEEAGAQAVLMSLWSVPDMETQDLMKRFYSKWLAGTEIHEALKEAQLELREEVKNEHDGEDLPCYWGAFVLVGR
jgi:CHAT domain-containing protein/Tfp pilus assembly protein PilF